MRALHNIPTDDLMHELVKRTIAGKDVVAAPQSLIQLLSAMTSMLGTQQCFVVAESLRDAADHLENLNEQVS